jgi:signal transduction histidine kinase
MVDIAIIDSGVGIESDRIDGLFSAFTKIMRFRELNNEGVGLGLTISKNLAVALGGDVTVKSVIGIGTTFTISIPFKEPPKKKLLRNATTNSLLLPPG